MKKILLVSSVFASMILLDGCTVVQSPYSPAYNSDYVYSVGYYGFRPYWGNRYYSGYGWGNHTWFGQSAVGGGHYYNRWYGRRY